MKRPALRRSKPEVQRAPRTDYQQQRAYHYSAKRSEAQRMLDRDETRQNAPPKRQVKLLHVLPGFLAAGLLAFSILYLASLSTTPHLTIDGDRDLLSAETSVSDRTSKILNNSILNKSKLTFQRDKVQEQMMAAFPELTRVEITTPFFRHQPHIRMIVAQPSVMLTNGSQLYVVDENGRAIFDATQNKPAFDTSSLPLVQDKTTFQLRQGAPVLTRVQVDYIKMLVFQTSQKNLNVASMTLSGGGGELDMSLGGLPYYGKFNMFEDPRKSVGTFLAMKERLERDKATPKEYIDVRIAERAYVR